MIAISNKFLTFSQLFGEEDPDQDVSPDTEDPEAAGDAGATALTSEAKTNSVGGIERKSTRQWAVESGYHAEKLFNKVSFICQKIDHLQVITA